MPGFLPEFERRSFACPSCCAISEMRWSPAFVRLDKEGMTAQIGLFNVHAAVCTANACMSLWVKALFSADDEPNMVYPDNSTAPPPNSDLPPAAKKLFEEARSVVQRSPRAAAALLRMSTEALVRHLTPAEDGALFRRIGYLVEEEDLPRTIQKALDSLRVIGNDAVHVVGEIMADDDRSTALKLFPLVNAIAYSMITQKNEIDALYESKVPEAKREAIERRDVQVR